MSLFDVEPDASHSIDHDPEADLVFSAVQTADPDGSRLAALMRSTLDQLYDGQRTGRFSWHQLHKTEKTHFGTLFEINLRREFDDLIDEGAILDYRINGLDVDCKFSQSIYGWMIPPEAIGALLLVGYVNDKDSEYAFGLVRAAPKHLREAGNRDRKVQLNPVGRQAVRWLQWQGELPPNVLLALDSDDIDAIFSPRSGQRRVSELFRRASRKIVSRNVVATVAQQSDYMKRVRANGGARDALRNEGMVILSGDYAAQREAATALGLVVPGKGELVSARVRPATDDDAFTALLDGTVWSCADDEEEAPLPAPRVANR